MPVPPPALSADPAPHYMTLAGVLLDLHRTLTLPGETAPTPRRELDTLHAHLVALHRIVDAHATRTHPVAQAEGDHLRAARTHLWQATEHLHHAYHHAPRPDGDAPGHDACLHRLPEGAPSLTVCQRHITALTRVRRHTTPADLRTPPGLVRHTKKGQD